jgi:epoxide hydrolase
MTNDSVNNDLVSNDIRPFRIEVADADLADLRDRLARTRWPEQLPDVGWKYGPPVGYLMRLVEYWRTTYDWRAWEAKLNAYPQFTTEIDGQRVHFLHVRSPEPDALPLILTHGWPGSVVEWLRVLGPLTDPRAHGADPAHAFHVVAPSTPGFGFSGPTTDTGWGTRRVAETWAELMRRLGYERYGAQGGDTGSVVSPTLGRVAPEHVVGVHVNGGLGFPSGDPAEFEGLTEAEQARAAIGEWWGSDGGAYAMLQATRPRMLAYGLHDSPVGQLSWIVNCFKEWTDPKAELPEDAVDLDQLLTNVTVYWLTGTAGSSARMYAEDDSWGQPARWSDVPSGVAVFPMDTGIRRIAEREHNVVHWSEFDRGGHFAAMEAPDLFVDDVRKFFGSLR